MGGYARRDLEDAANGADAPDQAADLEGAMAHRFGRYRGTIQGASMASLEDLGHGPDTLLDDYLEDA